MSKEGRRTKRLDVYHNSGDCHGRVQIVFIYLVEGFEFWVEGVCSECEAYIRVTMPLEQLITMTPNPQNRPFWKPPVKGSKILSPEDRDFLRDIGIKEDEDNGKNPPSRPA